MNGFVARMIERARGEVRGVEPLIASQFAPNESLANEPPPEMPAQPAPTSRVDPQVSEPNESKKRDADDARTANAGPRRAVATAERLLVPQFVEHEKRELPNQTKDAPNFSSPASPPSSPPAGIIRETARELLRQSNPRFSPQQEPTESGPAIRVTIGRIDVRAVPPAAPQGKPRRHAPPSLTLDAYLDARKKGAR